LIWIKLGVETFFYRCFRLNWGSKRFSIALFGWICHRNAFLTLRAGGVGFPKENITKRLIFYIALNYIFIDLRFSGLHFFKGFKMKKLALLFIALLSVSALADDLPRIAVYVTGNVGADEKEALGTRILASLVNSGRYIAIERSNSFLAEIEKEYTKQRSGDIDDSQISALGKQFGVKFVCIAAITPAFGDFQVSARIIDVETAVVVFIGESSGQLNSMDDLSRVSDNVVENMFSGKTSKAQKQTEQATVSQIQHNAPKGRKLDYYIAGRYVMPIGGMPAYGNSANLEGGLVWGNGMFFGFDINGGHSEKSQRVMSGFGFDLGNVYDLPVENLQFVYGGAAGWWMVLNRGSNFRDGQRDNYSVLAPFIKLRWNFVELSYRGLLGVSIYDDNDESEIKGFNCNHQIMLGVYFATSKGVR
jgi:hypothetical protein